MKVFLVAVIAVLALNAVQAKSGLSDEQKAKLQGLYKKCVAETGVDTELIMKARKKEFTEDEKLMAYYHCMFKNLKFQNDDGSLNVDLIVAKLPVEKKEGLQDIVKDCAASVKGASSPQQIVFKAFKCFVEKSNEEISFN